MPWPSATQLDTVRLILEPLKSQHATEMVAALAAPELYAFTGGEPPTEDILRSHYQRQAVGHSPASDAGWLNWIIRVKATQATVGYVQATLTIEDDALIAYAAWLVTPSAQHGGIATEAARTMLAWLLNQRVVGVRAFIHPHHQASARVARRLGFVSTPVVVDGESLWKLPGHAHQPL